MRSTVHGETRTRSGSSEEKRCEMFVVYRVFIEVDPHDARKKKTLNKIFSKTSVPMGRFKTLEEANECLNRYNNLHDEHMYTIIMEP